MTYPIIISAIVILTLIIIRLVLIKIIKKYARKFERMEHRTGLIIRYVDFFTIFCTVLGLIMVWGVQIKDLGLVFSSVFAVIDIFLILYRITSSVFNQESHALFVLNNSHL